MLVGYDQGVQEVIEYVFGSTLVCESLEVERVLMVEGDVFELSGIVEGGVLEASRKELGAMRGGAAKSALEVSLHKLEVLEKVGDELKHLLEKVGDEKKLLLEEVCDEKKRLLEEVCDEKKLLLEEVCDELKLLLEEAYDEKLRRV